MWLFCVFYSFQTHHIGLEQLSLSYYRQASFIYSLDLPAVLLLLFPPFRPRASPPFCLVSSRSSPGLLPTCSGCPWRVRTSYRIGIWSPSTQAFTPASSILGLRIRFALRTSSSRSGSFGGLSFSALSLERITSLSLLRRLTWWILQRQVRAGFRDMLAE